jgi:hypothetical protein
MQQEAESDELLFVFVLVTRVHILQIIHNVSKKKRKEKYYVFVCNTSIMVTERIVRYAAHHSNVVSYTVTYKPIVRPQTMASSCFPSETMEKNSD